MNKEDFEVYLQHAKLKFYYTLLAGFSGLNAVLFISITLALFSIMEPWRIALFSFFILFFSWGFFTMTKSVLFIRKLMQAFLDNDKEEYLRLAKEQKGTD